ncbi:hypothetical protein ACOMHN_054529 [Nucella lapillus]
MEEDEEEGEARRRRKEGEEGEEEEEEVVIEEVKEKRLIYKVSQNPPLRLMLLFTLQQGMLPIARTLSLSVLVTEVVCGRDDGELKIQILSATLLMTGLSTFCMSTFGIRLPIFQGPAATYVIPLFALASMEEWQCPTQEDLASYYGNQTWSSSSNFSSNLTLPVPKDFIHHKVQKLSGSLMVAGGLHFLIGVTGIAGFLLRFIGPVSIVPAITLVGLFIYKVTVKFCETNWPVAIIVSACGIVLSLYLRKHSTPIPSWSRRRGFHIQWFPVHQVFAVLISILIGWAVSGVMTYFDVLSDDRDSLQFYARTDTQLHVLHDTPWFSFPYPGKFGVPSFDGGVFASFFIATVLSVLDSIGDYTACSRMCYVPRPPKWAVNRGIAVEGLMSMLSGCVGTGHATVSYGGNIGAIGLTKVASRRVFQAVGLMYILLSVVSKAGAVFITVPYSVLGGTQILTAGIFIGIVLSNLHYVDLSSTRNLAIIGISLLLGLMIPFWLTKRPDAIHTGSERADNIVKILLSNPVFIGGCLACFMDNTVPGTRKERGILAEEGHQDFVKEDDENGDDEKEKDGDNNDNKGGDKEDLEEGMEVYDLPWLPKRLQTSSIAKVLRIFPGRSAIPRKKDAENGNLLSANEKEEKQSRI